MKVSLLHTLFILVTVGKRKGEEKGKGAEGGEG